MKLEEVAKILDQKVSAIDEKIAGIADKVNEYMDVISTAPDLLATHSTQYVQNKVSVYLSKIDNLLAYAEKWLNEKITEITKWANDAVKKVTDFASLKFTETQTVERSYKTADYSSDKTKSAKEKIVEEQKKMQAAASIADSLQTSSDDASKIANITNSTSKLSSMLDKLNQIGINMDPIKN